MSDNNKDYQVRFAIDRGGTFTDIYAAYGDEVVTLKLMSEDPQNYADAPHEGICRALEIITGDKTNRNHLGIDAIQRIRMGTTVATNALLERKGAPTALLITKGFADLLQIGYQNRPDIFDLKITKPDLLYERVIEVDERIRPAGPYDQKKHLSLGESGEYFKIIKEPDLPQLRKDLQTLKTSGITGLAIVFLHAYAFPVHELAVANIAVEMGFKQISVSSQIIPMIKAVPRGDTTVADAYLTPHIHKYLDSFKSGFNHNLTNKHLYFMQSDGGLSPAHKFSGSKAILSGPAAGVVGYAVNAFDKVKRKPVIGFDMGGTSTDVSRFDGEYNLVHETETAGVRIQAPQIEINTVAAGGGSRLFFKNGMFVVGPESSGAHPGPICYRKGGFLSVTDANLLLGRIQPEFFPEIFGPAENLPLDRSAVERAFDHLTAEINKEYKQTGQQPMSREEVAAGFLEVANQTMARPIREISIMRGYDIKDHILATFGGAGGQHACAIARMLGISEIFIHRFSGVLSAYGLDLADVAVERQQPAAIVYSNQKLTDICKIFKQLELAALDDLKEQGFDRSQTSTEKFLHMRFDGTNSAFMVKYDQTADTELAFRARHIREFGFDLAGQRIIIDDIKVRAKGHTQQEERPRIKNEPKDTTPEKEVCCFFDNQWQATPVYMLDKLGSGFSKNGPALIISPTSTVVLEPGCNFRINTFGDLAIEVSARQHIHTGEAKDPVQLAIFANLFMSIAEQMGRTLQRTSISTNIKERLDFSCAIFDLNGHLVANAPHIPVHLGAMSFAVREQIRIQYARLEPNDVLVSNHPAAGGSHLPDITVITPVWIDGEITFFTASRGHHADIGGISPGSMPPFSKTLEEEGVCIRSFKIVKQGIFQEDAMRHILKESRCPDDNISDLKAQVAANQKGIELLLEMVNHYGISTVMAYMKHIQDCTESAVRKMLTSIAAQIPAANSSLKAIDHMDDGSPLVLELTIDPLKGSALFDFTGSGQQVMGNWNAPKSVVYSSILYCLHCLAKSELPLNNGCLKPIDINIPEDSILNPAENAAVVGGNVLTSQRITDLVLKAFNAAAASQGCMNNLTFGNDTFGYYETIGGGAGAGPDWHGQSGVHTHMTNTRITDPEIIEKRYPVMLRQFSIRKGSGGSGKFKGGDGLVREFEALEQLQMSILSERRALAPFGLEGGENGKRGLNLYIKKGNAINLGGKNSVEVLAGERLKILTPGGGGFGKN